MDSSFDDIFALLEKATTLDASNSNRIEAATKYYQAVYLMEQQIHRLPRTQSYEAKRALLQSKVVHYRSRAAELMADDSSTLPKSVFLESIAENHEEETEARIVASPRSAGSDEVDVRASQADAKLALALDLDEDATKNDSEAIAVYMEAAELYLQALKFAEEHSSSFRMQSVSTVLKRRLQSTLDRIQELKETSKKRHLASRSRSMSPVPPSTPALSLSKEEVTVLMRSSLISTKTFLPWSEKDAIELSKQAQQGGRYLFKDPDGYLPLNKKQRARFFRWARPTDIVRLREKMGLVRHQIPELVRAITPYSIKQQYVTDCSFIASLCICASYERRFKKRLVTSIIYPRSKTGAPMLSPEGKYMCRLWLNGVARSVTVDDYLPIDQYGNLLCSHTSSPTDPFFELWVCIIEKAYMKLCGGYDFPGSNSGVDLFALTGWIPERIHFASDENHVRDHETPQERAWDRISSASSYGDCLITVSSQLDMPEHEADKLGLVMGHAYAVLSVVQTRRGSRFLLLKNPWASKSWRGRYSSHDRMSWRDTELRKELGYNPELAQNRDDGIFWIHWDDVLKYFRNFHLSWNPALFRYRTTTHGFWPKTQGPIDDTFNIGENPQYMLALSDEAVKKNATLWVQISRHVTKQEQEGVEADDFLTVHIHRATHKEQKVWYPGRSGNCVLTGAYTNNPQLLVRYDISSAEDKYLVLVLSQYKRSDDLAYTLSCYCTENFSFGKAQTDLVYCKDVRGDLCSAGGPVGSNEYSENAMVALSVPGQGGLVQFCLTVPKMVAVNVLLFRTSKYGDNLQGARGKAVVDSGNYRHAFVVTQRQHLPGGSYVAVISSFDRNTAAPFHLAIHSSGQVQAKLLSITN